MSIQTCNFCNNVVPDDYYITTVNNQIKRFDCCTEDTKSFIGNMCNCGVYTTTVPCNELIRYPALNTDICEQCFINLKQENERNK